MSAKKSTNLSLNAKVYFGAPLLGGTTLGTLQDLLARLCPDWASSLRLYPRQKGQPTIDLRTPGSIRDAVKWQVNSHGPRYYQLIEQFGSPIDPRENGCAEFRGGDKSLVLVIRVDEYRFAQVADIWIWGNHVTFQVR
jgi:hypothetical protein